MAANPEQKRRQQTALRRAIRIIRAHHPEIWAAAYRQARSEEAPPTVREGTGTRGMPASPVTERTGTGHARLVSSFDPDDNG